jgi:hypothetical protein
MDPIAEDLLAGFHQNNLWRYAALSTTGQFGGFCMLNIIRTVLRLQLFTEFFLSWFNQNCPCENIFVPKNYFYSEYIKFTKQ